jgi:DNA-binding LacI/PurR family transcriptional regulator
MLKATRKSVTLHDVAALAASASALVTVLAQDGLRVPDHVSVVGFDVVFDRTDNTYRATKHLLESGHRNIGFFFTGAPAYK